MTRAARSTRVLRVVVIACVLAATTVVTALASSSYSSTVLADSPYIYYRLGEASGTTAADSAGTAQNGTYRGGDTLGAAGAVAGDTNTAVTLNGSTGYVSNSTAVTPSTSALSYEAWFRTTTAAGGTLVDFENYVTGTSTREDRTLYMLGNGRLVFGIGLAPGTTVTTPEAYNDGRWHQVVAAFGGSDGLRLYVDGAQVATNLGFHSAASYTGYYRVGDGTLTGWTQQPGSAFFAGTIDEVSIYTTELTAAKVSTHYAANQLHPSAPQTPSATAPGGNEADVTWTTPATPGPLAITGYAISALIGTTLADTVTAGATATSVTFDGLDAGSVYTFTVYALNANGPGPGATTASVTVTGPYTTYRSTVLADSPSGYWRLDDVSGSPAQDSSTAADTGIYQRGVTRLQPGAMDTDADVAAGFDGSTGYVTTSNLVSTAPNVFTVEAWFQTTSTSGGRIIGWSGSQYGQSSNYDRHVYMTAAGNLVFGVYNGAVYTVTSPLAYNDGSVHLVDATLSAAGMVLYVDGNQVASSTATTTAQSGSGYWRIGYDNLAGWPSVPPSDWFQGTIDDAAVYPAALTAARVLAHYQAQDAVGLSISAQTPSFTLNGNAITTASSNAAATLVVSTNDPRGYTVSVQAGAAVLSGAAPGNTDTIPVSDLAVRETGTTAYTPLSSTAAATVHSQASQSAPTGDTVSTDYRVTIPFVNSDTYSVPLTYVATAQ